VVQIRIKKSDTAAGGGHYGGRYNNKSSTMPHKWKFVGDPIICRISPTLTVAGLRAMLGRRISHALRLDDRLGQTDIAIMKQAALTYENNATGRSSSAKFNSNNESATLGSVTEDEMLKNGINTSFTNKSSDNEKEKERVSTMVDHEGTIYLNWPPQHNDIFDEELLFAKDEYLTEQQKEEMVEGKNARISIMDCIAKYCEKEQLDETEMWYCNKCKEHVRAWKKFDLYRTPPILIIHLKRFHFSSTTHRRDKIDTLIDFPLEGLDLRNVVKNWSEKQQGEGGNEHEPIYDCYAVSNHFGGLGGGHYTAYAKGVDGSWCNFDDSRVTTGVDESEVVSSAAYCLYYKRKDVVAFEKDEDDNEEDDDAIMTKEEEDENNIGFNQGMMPVSPSPSPLDHNNDTNNDSMEVDNQDDRSSGTGGTANASFATPADGLDGDDYQELPTGLAVITGPAPEEEAQFDLQMTDIANSIAKDYNT